MTAGIKGKLTQLHQPIQLTQPGQLKLTQLHQPIQLTQPGQLKFIARINKKTQKTENQTSAGYVIYLTDRFNMYEAFNTNSTMTGDTRLHIDEIAVQNSEKLLAYICDLNLDRPLTFEPTPSQGLYIRWNVQDWEFHMECVKNGSIMYTFRKWGVEAASGINAFDDFIPRLENFLLTSMDQLSFPFNFF